MDSKEWQRGLISGMPRLVNSWNKHADSSRTGKTPHYRVQTGERHMKWSVYFQNPEYLEQTRMFLIQPELKPLIRRWCHVGNGTRILDVGCEILLRLLFLRRKTDVRGKAKSKRQETLQGGV